MNNKDLHEIPDVEESINFFFSNEIIDIDVGNVILKTIITYYKIIK